jgi:hypothetical protein
MTDTVHVLAGDSNSKEVAFSIRFCLDETFGGLDGSPMRSKVRQTRIALFDARMLIYENDLYHKRDGHGSKGTGILDRCLGTLQSDCVGETISSPCLSLAYNSLK